MGTVQREIDAIVEISLGEEKIRTAPEHPFYINGQWKAAGELEVGEMVTTMVQEQVISGQAWEEKKPIEIKENSILVEGVTYHTDKKEKVYNFEVEGWHTYFVGWLRVLVHNAKACIKGAIKRVAKRLLYMGRTPGKKSRTGREVFERMMKEVPPTARVRKGVQQFKDSDGVWRNIKEADMGHKDDAVSWWNREGRKHGAKSKEVRAWMLDSRNYVLEYYKTNRSKGAQLIETYLPPLK